MKIFLQAPDVSWNAHFKASKPNTYADWLENREKQLTKANNIRPCTKMELCDMVVK